MRRVPLASHRNSSLSRCTVAIRSSCQEIRHRRMSVLSLVQSPEFAELTSDDDDPRMLWFVRMNVRGPRHHFLAGSARRIALSASSRRTWRIIPSQRLRSARFWAYGYTLAMAGSVRPASVSIASLKVSTAPIPSSARPIAAEATRREPWQARYRPQRAGSYGAGSASDPGKPTALGPGRIDCLRAAQSRAAGRADPRAGVCDPEMRRQLAAAHQGRRNGLAGVALCMGWRDPAFVRKLLRQSCIWAFSSMWRPRQTWLMFLRLHSNAPARPSTHVCAACLIVGAIPTLDVNT
jgi:hypothetical protein